jgi:hypothetical protein
MTVVKPIAHRASALGMRLAVGLLFLVAAIPLEAQQPTPQELRDVARELAAEAASNVSTVAVAALGPMNGPWPEHGGAYRIDLLESESSSSLRSASQGPVGQVHIVLGKDGIVWRVSTDMRDLRPRVEDYRRAFEAHPEWSERDAIQALALAGAKFLPPDAERVMARIRLHSLRRWMTVTSVEPPRFQLQWQNEDPAVHGRARTLNQAAWHARVRARLSNGQEREYGVVVEPFDGTIAYLGADTR